MSEDLKQKVSNLIEPTLRAHGYDLADLTLSRYKSSATLRVFVYGQERVTLDECGRLSRQIGEVIEGTNLFEGGYTLEVSSPGLDRPLKTARDFKYRIGETVRLFFTDPKRKQVTAEIVSATEDQVEFSGQDGSFTVPLAEIEKAKIVF
jgi:ribosome maturation factor RimP